MKICKMTLRQCAFAARDFCALFLVFMLSSCGTSPTAGNGSQKLTPAHLNPSEITLYETALADMRAGNMEKAITILQPLHSAHPIHLGVNVNLATAYYTTQNVNSAITLLDAAQKINPKSAEIHNLYGLIHVAKEEYPAAEKNYLAALACNNNFALAHYNLALVYDNFYQDIDSAIAHYQQYLALVGNADKETSQWLEELKRKAKHTGGL
jgi:tetratricopeptide (TPR) repeat protein